MGVLRSLLTPPKPDKDYRVGLKPGGLDRPPSSAEREREKERDRVSRQAGR